MKLQEYRFLSGDGEDELYGCAWLPDGTVKGYIQILHDLYDHIERYVHLLPVFRRTWLCRLWTRSDWSWKVCVCERSRSNQHEAYV